MATWDNLVSYWKMNETSGQRNDSVGSVHLADNNTVLYDTGKLGNAAKFVAANSEYFDATNAQFADTSFHCTFWLNATTTVGAPIGVWNGWGSNGHMWMLRFDGTALDLFYSTNGVLYPNVTASTAISAGTWYFIAVGHDGTNLLLRVNSTDEQSSVGGLYTGYNVLHVGTEWGDGSGHNYYNGLIDEIAWFSSSKSTTDLDSIYNGGAGLPYGAGATQILMFYAERIRRLYSDFRAGILPRGILQRRYHNILRKGAVSA